MKTLVACCLLLFASASAADRPDWAQRSFAAPPDRVYQAAKAALTAEHHEVKEEDPAAHVLRFHIGTTAWSWGYNMVLRVEPSENGGAAVVVDIDRSGGKAVSWGSGTKEVRKIFAEMETYLHADIKPKS